jgi:hypothetical protein
VISNIKGTEGYGAGTIKKTIHEGSESIMFSVLQETQYMYPFKSSVREIVSNCLDSITERDNSLRILSGELKVEDLYIEKEGSEMADSGFNAEYYAPAWLSNDKKVYITYIENDTNERDRIMFKDYGVGLGGNRLINYFSLGFSSKRKSKNQLGSFGLGAKSLLATGVDFYTVTSGYNGKIFSFNIYKDHIESAITKFEEDGTMNNEEVFFEGTEKEYRTYYRTTTEKNFVVVECEVKRFRKNDFITSIENQLGYIPGIELRIKDGEYPSSSGTIRNIENKVLIRQGNIMVGEADYYSVPQILLRPGDESNVCISYGPINFEELEMKRYTGNVCFVLNINEVDVTPSRESVIWNNKTREAIKTAFLLAQQEAEKIISDQLVGIDNLIDYYKAFNDLIGSASSSTGLSELYKIIDKKDIKATFGDFDIVKVAKAIDMSDLLSKGLLFTGETTGNTPSDWKYLNFLSPKFLASMSSIDNANKNTYVYISDKKSSGILRYISNKYGFSSYTNTSIIYIKPELYEKLETMIGTKTPEEVRTGMYATKSSLNMLLAEMIYFIKKNPARVIESSSFTDSDVEMFKQVKQPEYQTKAQLNKAAGLVSVMYGSNGSRYKKYISLSNLPSNSVVYQLSDPLAENIHRVSGVTIGLSQEHFRTYCSNKEFHRQNSFLAEKVFKITGGDFELTPYGVSLLDAGSSSNFVERKLELSALNFCKGNFTDVKINKSTFDAQCHRFLTRNKSALGIYADN